MASKRRAAGSTKPQLVILLVLCALLLPLIVVLSFLGTAVKINEIKSMRGNNVEPPIAGNDLESLDSRQSNSHFIISQNFISKSLCINDRNVNGGQESAFKTADILENTPVTFSVDESSQHNTWQLCFAHHDHQHGFRIKTFPNPVSSDLKIIPKVDCDLYLSATATSPSRELWDWKSSDTGHDSITIYSYAHEFQESKLDALFISVGEKQNNQNNNANEIGNEKNEPIRNRCVLEVEIITVPNEELLHKVGSLRGGQVLLPRDLKRIIAAQRQQ